jgi:hypothetical protein
MSAAPKNTPLPNVVTIIFFPKKKECKFERIHKTEDLSEAREARAREWAEDGSRSGPPVGAKTEEERE